MIVTAKGEAWNRKTARANIGRGFRLSQHAGSSKTWYTKTASSEDDIHTHLGARGLRSAIMGTSMRDTDPTCKLLIEWAVGRWNAVAVARLAETSTAARCAPRIAEEGGSEIV